jgi:serine/threonine-protein kinase RsbW
MPLEPVKISIDVADIILTRIRFKANSMAVRLALEYARQSWQGAGVDTEICNTGEQVLAEVLNNVVEHAQAGRPDGQIELDTHLGTDGVICSVRDDGAEMPGQELPEGKLHDLTMGLDHLPEGGFGWYLIHTLTEDLYYERKNGWNRLNFRITRDRDTHL